MGGLFYTGQRKYGGGAFTVTLKNGDKLAQKLAKLDSGAETAIKRTVSDFTARAPAWVSKGIRQHYGVDTAAISEAGPTTRRGASSIHVAGVSVDSASLKYKGRTLTPTHFNMSPKSRPTAQQSKHIKVPGQIIAGSPVAMVRPPRKYTVKASIIKGSRVSISDAIIAPGKGGINLPFQTSGDNGRALEAVRTLSVPQMISGKAKDTIEELIGSNLEKRFEHHIQQAMK